MKTHRPKQAHNVMWQVRLLGRVSPRIPIILFFLYVAFCLCIHIQTIIRMSSSCQLISVYESRELAGKFDVQCCHRCELSPSRE